MFVSHPSTADPLQSANPALQVPRAQLPFWQIEFPLIEAAHACPQPPQLLGSDNLLVQSPEQIESPDGQDSVKVPAEYWRTTLASEGDWPLVQDAVAPFVTAT
jgi:hypothetical protein